MNSEIEEIEEEDDTTQEIRLATKIINDFVKICTPDQIGQIESVRYWLEVYGVE